MFKIGKRDYIVYDFGDLYRYFDVWFVEFRIIYVVVLYIFFIRNLIKEIVLIDKKEKKKLVILYNY